MIRTPVPRVAGWQRAMLRVLHTYDGKPFAWGGADCLTAAGDVVQALTGIDPISDWRGRYGLNAFASLLYFRRLGYVHWGTAAGDRFRAFGWPSIDPRAAMVGDVGLTDKLAFAVRLPRGFVVRTQAGVWAVAPEITTAWRIG